MQKPKHNTMKKTLAILLFVCSLSAGSMAQSFNLLEGDLSAVKKEKKMNLECTYDNMGVDNFAFETVYMS